MKLFLFRMFSVIVPIIGKRWLQHLEEKQAAIDEAKKEAIAKELMDVLQRETASEHAADGGAIQSYHDNNRS